MKEERKKKQQKLPHTLFVMVSLQKNWLDIAPSFFICFFYESCYMQRKHLSQTFQEWKNALETKNKNKKMPK